MKAAAAAQFREGGGESQDQMAERRERAQEGGRAMPAIIDKAQGLSVEEMHPLDLL